VKLRAIFKLPSPTWVSFEFFTFCILEGEANFVVNEDVVEVDAVVAVDVVDDVDGAFPVNMMLLSCGWPSLHRLLARLSLLSEDRSGLVKLSGI